MFFPVYSAWGKAFISAPTCTASSSVVLSVFDFQMNNPLSDRSVNASCLLGNFTGAIFFSRMLLVCRKSSWLHRPVCLLGILCHGTSCRWKYLFCSPLLIGVRGRPWYSFWPCFWSSYLKMKDAAFHGLFFGPLFEHHCGSLMKRSVIGNVFLCYHPGGGSKFCPLFGSFIVLMELDPAGWS